MLPTLMFGARFVEAPNEAFTVTLGLFPLSAPSAMVTRLAAAPVPTWQLLVSLVGVTLSG